MKKKKTTSITKNRTLLALQKNHRRDKMQK